MLIQIEDITDQTQLTETNRNNSERCGVFALIREEHCGLADGVKMSLGWNGRRRDRSFGGALSTEFLKWCQFALESAAVAAAAVL